MVDDGLNKCKNCGHDKEEHAVDIGNGKTIYAECGEVVNQHYSETHGQEYCNCKKFISE
jgi:hypothetical protein